MAKTKAKTEQKAPGGRQSLHSSRAGARERRHDRREDASGSRLHVGDDGRALSRSMASVCRGVARGRQVARSGEEEGARARRRRPRSRTRQSPAESAGDLTSSPASTTLRRPPRDRGLFRGPRGLSGLDRVEIRAGIAGHARWRAEADRRDGVGGDGRRGARETIGRT